MSSEPAAKVHLTYLDGLRGLAACYVALHHTSLILVRSMPPDWQPHALLRATSALFGFGHTAVVVFIVLSGYVLMMPVARSADASLRGGFIDYLKRRAQRILPAYYGALALSGAVVTLSAALGHAAPSDWWVELPVTSGAVISHLLLIHNLDPERAYKIAGVLWSVATEWQIYFAFALVLLPVYRRFGMLGCFALAFVAGVALGRVDHARFAAACPWFLGLFAMGMAAAVLNFRPSRARNLLEALSARGLLVPSALGIAAVCVIASYRYVRPWAFDSAFGVATALLIADSTIRSHAGKSSRLMRLFSSPPAVWLGENSYSIYLVHVPALATLSILLASAGLSPLARFWLLHALGLPLALLFAHGFSLVFERRVQRSAFSRRSVAASPT